MPFPLKSSWFCSATVVTSRRRSSFCRSLASSARRSADRDRSSRTRSMISPRTTGPRRASCRAPSGSGAAVTTLSLSAPMLELLPVVTRLEDASNTSGCARDHTKTALAVRAVARAIQGSCRRTPCHRAASSISLSCVDSWVSGRRILDALSVVSVENGSVTRVPSRDNWGERVAQAWASEPGVLPGIQRTRRLLSGVPDGWKYSWVGLVAQVLASGLSKWRAPASVHPTVRQITSVPVRKVRENVPASA